MPRHLVGTVLLWLTAVGSAAAQQPPDKNPAAVVKLFEDESDFFIDHLTNNGARDASVAARSEQTLYSGACSLSVTSFQRFRTQLPGWNYTIAEHPEPGEFRYLRFAWKRTEAPGIMLQLFTLPKNWKRYYAGTLSKTTQAWTGPMIRVADDAPRQWELVTRDLFEDFGPSTITGISFTALEGPGTAYFDHIYLGRTSADLDSAAQNPTKVADAAAPDAPAGPPAPARQRWTVVLVGAAVICAMAIVLFLMASRRAGRERARAQWIDPESEPAETITCTCAECGKKLQVKAARAGKTVKCPHCGASVAVPRP